MNIKKFRPQNHSALWAIRMRRLGNKTWCGKYNWHTFSKNRKSQRWIFTFFGILHYYTDHSPIRVAKKWSNADKTWNKRCAKKASMRYITTYSIEKDL